jgi:cysteine desulfurase
MPDWIYLDNNATTRPLDEVAAAMAPLLHDLYANPSSIHPFGQALRHCVECARAQVAALLGADSKEIIFTGSGTEAINLAIRGTLALRPNRRQVIGSTVEHSAVQKVGAQLVREGYRYEEVAVDGAGRLNLEELAARITDDTALVSLMWVNNETGVIFDMDAIATLCAARGVPLHVDAVQAVGKIPIDLRRTPVTLLSIAAHKFHGPKGIGALFVRQRTRLRPMILGGGQERDLRGGTENVPGIVGMGVAAAAMHQRDAEFLGRIQRMRDRLESGLLSDAPQARVHGAHALRVPNTTNIGFAGLASQAILMLLGERGICVSGGSACASGSLEPSHVLLAMNVPREYAHGAIRFSLSEFTTDDEIDRCLASMREVVPRLAAMSV